jgi:protein involved in polysaccharide export with SLBB domain
VLVIPADLLRTGDPDGNIFVRPGDVIRIVSGEIGVYYVMGQVNRVGAFAFNAEPVTLKAAIAAAGGLAPLAWPDRCTVYRRIGQREQMLQVNLDRIFAGQDPDFLIHRNDIINIGTHPLAPFVQSLRGLTIPNPVSNVGYSFTYARNFADIDSFAVQQNPQNQPSQFPQLFP